MLPFPFMGWVDCIADTAWDWQFSGLLNNVHTARCRAVFDRYRGRRKAQASLCNASGHVVCLAQKVIL